MKTSSFPLLLLIYLVLPFHSHSQSDSCLHFNGVNQYVRIGDVNDLGTSDFTIEAWIFIEDTEPYGNKVISKGLTTVGTPSNAGYALRTAFDVDDELEFHIGDSDGTVVAVKYFGLELNQWYHIAGVRKGTRLQLFLNGELVGIEVTESIFNVDTNMPLAIGAIDKNGLSSTNEYMSGKIDEARIWDVALTGSEIMANMDCAITNPEPNLLAVYNFNKHDDTFAYDSSGFDNHGVLYASLEWVGSTVALECTSGLFEENSTVQLSMAPNPAGTSTILSSQNEASLIGSTISLLDINGKVLFMDRINGASYELDVSDYEKGIYFVEIMGQSNRTVKKLIIQ